MPIIINTSQSTASTPGITTRVSDIENCVSQDVRGVLQTSGDAGILIDYTNRVSMEILRYSRWKFLLSPVMTFQTVLLQTDYWIGPVGGGPNDTGLAIDDISSIKRDSVFDRTSERRLFQTEEQPVSFSLSGPNAKGYPRVWRNDISTPSVINIYPPADKVYTIQFRYYKPRVVLTAPTQTIQVPDIYKDVICAGVNALAFNYLDMDERAAFWAQQYQAGKASMIRDKNLFPGDGDYIRPDTSGIVPTNNTALGLDASIQWSIP